MSTVQTWQITSTDSEKTAQLAEVVGHKLRGGEIIELVGDLGSGKTLFVQGLARGMGSYDAVHSPSFTISNQYRAGQKTLYHFDFYRLSDPGIIKNELAELLNDPQAVVVIEWAGIIENVLPGDRLTIALHAVGQNSRALTFSCPKEMNYLIPKET